MFNFSAAAVLEKVLTISDSSRPVDWHFSDFFLFRSGVRIIEMWGLWLRLDSGDCVCGSLTEDVMSSTAVCASCVARGMTSTDHHEWTPHDTC